MSPTPTSAFVVNPIIENRSTWAVSGRPPEINDDKVFDVDPICPSPTNPVVEQETSFTKASIPLKSIITLGFTVTFPEISTSSHVGFPVVIRVYWYTVVWLTETVGEPIICFVFGSAPLPKTSPSGNINKGSAFTTSVISVAPPPKV